MADHRLISSDNHVFEPPDMWTSRIKPEYRDRCPRVVDSEKGPVWVVEDRTQQGFGQGAQAGLRFEESEHLSSFGEWEDVRPGGYDPLEAVKDMDIDGVDVSLLYPSIGLLLYYNTRDSGLFTEVCRVYNDWLGEYCSAAPERLRGIAMLNVDDVEVGIREMERCAKTGQFAGAMIPVYPPESKRYELPDYEPLWAAAQDMDMPLGLHITTVRMDAQQYEYQHMTGNSLSLSKRLLINCDHWIKMSLSDIMLAGVFDRYPKLQVGSVEHELSWVPYFLMKMDWHYRDTPTGRDAYQLKNAALPSDVFRQNIFVDIQEDAVGIELRHKIGVDNILWGSDYPHIESTFPKSREILDDILRDCTEEEKQKIVGGNAARIYRL